MPDWQAGRIDPWKVALWAAFLAFVAGFVFGGLVAFGATV